MESGKQARIDTQLPFDHTALIHFLQGLEQHYSFLKFDYLGASVLDRGIPIVKLGNGNRAVLYVGAHHGMEWITSAILTTFLSDLCEAIVHDRNVGGRSPKAMLEAHTIYIIPMLNPDGTEYQIHGIDKDNPLYDRLISMNKESMDFSHWQANARGVDLNHNYDAGFWDYKKLEADHGISEGAPTRYSGDTPESEPEVRALCNFIRYHTELCGVMTLHTQGEEIFYCNESITLPRARRIANHLAKLSGYTLSNAEGLSSFGGLTDWCIQKMHIPSFTVECGKGKNPLPFTDLYPIYSVLRNMLFSFPILL